MLNDCRVYGYTRVSTKEQNLDRGIQSIKSFCSERGWVIYDRDIYTDKSTGKNFERVEYESMKHNLRTGDILVIPEYDRLGRSAETAQELSYFKEHGIRVVFLDIPTTQNESMFGDTPEGKLIYEFVNSLLVEFSDLIARQELERKKKRQREGIDAKKARGEWDDYGRPRKLSRQQFAEQYQRVIKKEISNRKLIAELGISPQTYYKYRKEYIDNK